MARVLLVIFIGVLIIGCEAPVDRIAEQNKAIVERIYELFMEDDWETLADYFAPDFIDHNPDPGQTPDFEGVREAFREIHNGFPNFTITVKHMIAEGDYVCSRLEFAGTHQGDYYGMQPTGRAVVIEGYDLIRIVDGKAVERWGLFDTFEFLVQVGVIEPPAM